MNKSAGNSRQRDSQCKGPEAQLCLVHLRNSAEASVAGAKGARMTVGGYDGREVMRPCRPREDSGFCSE